MGTKLGSAFEKVVLYYSAAQPWGKVLAPTVRFMSHVRSFLQNLESPVIGLAQFHVDPTLSKSVPIQKNYSYFVIGATWLDM